MANEWLPSKGPLNGEQTKWLHNAFLLAIPRARRNENDYTTHFL